MCSSEVPFPDIHLAETPVMGCIGNQTTESSVKARIIRKVQFTFSILTFRLQGDPFEPSIASSTNCLRDENNPNGLVECTKKGGLLFKCLMQIRDQIFRVLDSAGETDHVVGNAHGASLFGGKIMVAHDKGLLDQRFYPSQAGADPRNPNRIDHVGRFAPIGISEKEGDQATVALHGLAGNLMIAMTGESRKVDLLDAGVTFQKFGHCLAVLILTLDP